MNERIRAREIRLIGADGEQLGVVTPEEGRARADEEGYDLVEVAPNASPPVCRIMDYGKYKYEQKKKAAAGKAKGRGRAASLKEVKMRPSTDDHDLAFKLKNARRFLMDGDGAHVRRLTSDASVDRSPTWLATTADVRDIGSTGGKNTEHSQWVIFESDRAEAGKFDLYAMHIVTGEIVRLTDDASDDTDAVGMP